MYILGIAPYYDSSACLLKDGKLVAAVGEERFNRIKHYGGFPFNSVNYVLSEAGININEVDMVAFPNINPNIMFKKFVNHFFLKGMFRLEPWQQVMGTSMRAAKSILYERLGAKYLKDSSIKGAFNEDQIFYSGHHMAHASSAYLCSPFKESMIMTIDGGGDWTSTMLASGKDNAIEVVERIHTPNSLGYLYATFTQYLGYTKGTGHEGKVMGLASYGKPHLKVEDIISVNGGHYNINPEYAYGVRALDKLEMRLNRPRLEKSPDTHMSNITVFHKDLAATIQKKTEEAVLGLLGRFIEENGTNSKSNLCLGGGVALNCVMNGKLLQSGLIDDIFIQPSAGDNGNSLGAALNCWASLGYKRKFVMDHAYWGPSYSNEQIKEKLDEYKIKYTYEEDIAGICAELLAKGKIVLWFQGRLEFGPRALGNRSVLGDPTDPKMKDRINYYVKHRENWRPFAPSLLEEAKEEYLTGAYNSPFMILAFDVPEEKRKEIPAVVHVDGTTRAHTVSKRTNPLYWRLIKEFENYSGVPVVLNTSFNVKGEPIVCTPSDAIRTFYSGGADYLAMGNYLIKK